MINAEGLAEILREVWRVLKVPAGKSIVEYAQDIEAASDLRRQVTAAQAPRGDAQGAVRPDAAKEAK